MKTSYIHADIPEISTDYLKEGDVIVRNFQEKSLSEIMEIAVITMKIALRIGIRSPVYTNHRLQSLPYTEENDNLVFECPINSLLLNRKVNFLRGWKQFESCVKGFNSLGLMAEQLQMELQRLDELNAIQLNRIKLEFLRTRVHKDHNRVFSDHEIDSLSTTELLKINRFDLGLWKCFANKTIVCSTSSNMGMSLHDSLRYLQKTTIAFKDKIFPILNYNEGRLIIWCPDENADFMNKEKTLFLRNLSAEKPPLTRLRTYINRVQRDPGALHDALLCGGYFFPTNPQSRDEVQNLLFFALTQIAEERKCSFSDLLKDEGICETLRTLHSVIEDDKVYVDEGIEGGISGLMIPYFIMLEELLPDTHTRALSTWNQVSIGAALAAAVIADMILRDPSVIGENVRSEFNSLFPNISRFLDSRKLGRSVETRIHGLFDLANLQSLAQLLGVVVEKHLSGRGTAYVGLGSSSYSNGNRCYEILKASMEKGGAFKGKSTFHPATHTLNPFAQALIWGEDLFRAYSHSSFKELSAKEKVIFIKKHTRKPEPAGAAAYAGYLLARLDNSTLSIVEIAYILKLLGFSKGHFLQFCNLPTDDRGLNKFLQEAAEEGRYMGDLARNILLMLEWPLEKLEKRVQIETEYSRLKYKLYPLDDAQVDNMNPQVNIYLTGDNTSQPSDELIEHVTHQITRHEPLFKRLINSYYKNVKENHQYDTITFTSLFFTNISRKIKRLNEVLNRLEKRALNHLVYRKVNKITKRN